MPIPMLPHHVDKAAAKRKSQPQPVTHEDSSDDLIQQARGAPDTLRAADVFQLQRTIGNQAVSRLLNTPPRQPTISETGQSFIQLKRTTKPDDQALVDKFESGLPDKVLNGIDKLPEQGEAIWKHLNEMYTTNLQKGTGYWQDLQVAINNYRNWETRPQATNSNTVKRTGYDQLFNANYSNTLENKTNDKYHVSSEGYDSANAQKPVVPTGQNKGNYSNLFDLGKGTIHAKWNFGAELDRDTGQVLYYKDDALGAKKGVNNSEILWQQYKLAAKQKYQTDNEVKQAMKSITRIKRETVINDETKETVYMAYPDGEDWDTTKKEWQPGQEEFFAILGTPNAKSSVFFLKDHMDEIEKTIRQIKTSGGSLKIDYTPIPPKLNKPLPPPPPKKIDTQKNDPPTNTPPNNTNETF